MIFFQIFRGQVTEDKSPINLKDAYPNFPDTFKPLIRRSIDTQASLLGVDSDILLRDINNEGVQETDPYGWVVARRSRRFRDGEIFTDGEHLFAIALEEPREFEVVRRSRAADSDELLVEKKKAILHLFYLGKELTCGELEMCKQIIGKTFNIDLIPSQYKSEKLEALKKEGSTPAVTPEEKEIIASILLKDKAIRNLLITIKASGGLLKRDLEKQNPQGSRGEIIQNLISSGLVYSELVVICNRGQSQVLRIPSREILESWSQQGLKCACGRPVIDERIEEAITITDFGKYLLDKSRWMTILLIQELLNIGIDLDSILVEQQAGGDEFDLICSISGELILFELKDKEFNLGNAYSFGAKIGIIQPRYSVIVTTEYVGSDAKEHFQRSGLFSKQRRIFDPDEEGHTDLRYFEGLDGLTKCIENLSGEIYQKDGSNILGQILSLGMVDPNLYINAINR